MKNLATFFLLFSSAIASSQFGDDSTGAKQFDLALAYYEEGHLDSAVLVWTAMVENKTAARYDTYGSAFFNIPTVYWQMEEYDKAKEWYLKILASDLRDSDETGSLMEPHTNYKHKAAVGLAGLYDRDSNYAQTLYWLGMADTVYRYWGFEGSATSITKRQAYLLGWRVDVLMQTGKTKEAVRAIITELICAGDLAGFFQKSEQKLMTVVNIEDKLAFTKALEGLQVTKLTDHEWQASFVFQDLVYTLPISDQYPDENIPHYWRKIFVSKGSDPQPKEITGLILLQEFYRNW